MPHQGGEQFHRGLDSDYVVEVWQRRKWLAIAVFIAAFAAIARGTLSLPDLYRASASVLVSRQQVSEAYVKTSVTAELETRIQTIHQQLMSRSALRDLILELGLHPEFGTNVPDWVMQRMRRDIALDPKSVPGAFGRSTIAFTLTYSGLDPESVVRVTNTLAERYVQENTRSRTGQAARTAGFLKSQLDGVKRELDVHEKRASEFKLLHGAELPDQMMLTLSALERSYSKLRLNTEQQIRAADARDRLQEQLAEAQNAAAVPATSGQTTPGRLGALQQELAKLREQFTDQHPDVIRLTAQVAALERDGEPEGTNGHDAAASPAAPATSRDSTVRIRRSLADAEVQLKSLKEEEAFLRQSIAQYEGRIENAPKLQQEYKQLSSEYEVTRERYAMLLKRYEEAQLADNLEQGQSVEQFQILDPAIPPNGPAAPNRMQLLIMGLAASLGLAFGAVVAAERLDTTFHRVDDLRAFVNVRTLATIRLVPTAEAARKRRRRFAFGIVLYVVALAFIIGAAHYFASGNEQLLRMVARFS